MKGFVAWITSSVGAKVLMAVTGLILVGFLLGHMAGNLQIFAGRDTLNAYAQFLQDHATALWLVRLILIAVFVTHVASSVRLTLLNRAARPIAYAVQTPVKSTLFSRTMFISGTIILAFLVYHLLHFTFVTTNPEYASLPLDPLGRKDVYTMVVLGFQNEAISAVYIVGMLLLASHLSHAVSSFLQTLGFGSRRLRPIYELAGPLTALILAVGNISMPIAVLTGIVRLPAGVL